MPADTYRHDSVRSSVIRPIVCVNSISSDGSNSTKQNENRNPLQKDGPARRNGYVHALDKIKIPQQHNAIHEPETKTKKEDDFVLNRKIPRLVHTKSLSISSELIIENDQICSYMNRKRCKSEGSATPLLSPTDDKGDKESDIDSQKDDIFTPKENKNDNYDLDSIKHDTLSTNDFKITQVSEDVNINELVDEDSENDRNITLSIDNDVDDHSKVKKDSAKSLIENHDRSSECKLSTAKYIEIHHKIEELTHDYQLYNNRVTDIYTKLFNWKRSIGDEYRKLKYCSIMTHTVTLVMFFCVFSILFLTRAYVAAASQEELRLNITNKLSTLKYQYGTMTKMVQDLVKTRPVIKVTSGNKFSLYDNKYYVAWRNDPNCGQGSLHLSQNGDSIIAEAGGYYLITCNLFYMFTNTNSRVELEYDILQKVDASHSSVVQNAFVQFRANVGHMRRNVATHAVVYLFPGDEIQVGLDPAQRKLTARFDKAHSLSMFLID